MHLDVNQGHDNRLGRSQGNKEDKIHIQTSDPGWSPHLQYVAALCRVAKEEPCLQIISLIESHTCWDNKYEFPYCSFILR